MKTFLGLQQFINSEFYGHPTAVALGVFDGIHRGHASIISNCEQIADKSTGLFSLIVTFWPHPRKIITGISPPLLTTLEERRELFDKFKPAGVLFLDFNQEFSRISARDFVSIYLAGHFNCRDLSVGFNFRFGHQRGGDVSDLVKLGNQFNFSTFIGPRIKQDNHIISSSLIRQLIATGEIEAASRMLGYHYPLTGRVVSGAGRGRSLGFPTANLELENQEKLLPANGVYAVTVEIERVIYSGVVNIGVVPTFRSSGQKSIEVFIDQFEGNLYNRFLTLRFYHRIREEVKFHNRQQLACAIAEDLKIMRSWFARDMGENQ